MTQHYAVIGAGAGGLCAAKYLVARGFEVTIFEAGSHIGGLWVYNNDSGMSPAYKSLHINSEARVSTFVDFPFPDGASLYPDHHEMSLYFERYAQHFDLVRRIRFRSRVSSITSVEGRFRVSLESGSEETFDGVVVATGHQSVPRHPPQIEGFTVESMLELAKTSVAALSNLPDERDWDGLNRKWVADILYTIERAKFEKVIKDAVKARKERLEEKHKLNVEMRPVFAQALQNCMSFSSNVFLIA